MAYPFWETQVSKQEEEEYESFTTLIKKNFFGLRFLSRQNIVDFRGVFGDKTFVLTPFVLTPIILTPIVLTNIVLTNIVLTPLVHHWF